MEKLEQDLCVPKFLLSVCVEKVQNSFWLNYFRKFLFPNKETEQPSRGGLEVERMTKFK